MTIARNILKNHSDAVMALHWEEAKVEDALKLLKAMMGAYPEQPISVWFYAISEEIRKLESDPP